MIELPGSLAGRSSSPRPGADRRAALRQRHHTMIDRRFDPPAAAIELMGIAGKFLPQRQRSRILQMGAADLDDRFPPLCLGIERGVEPVERWKQRFRDRQRGGDVQRGGEAVVGGLTEVHTVVGMDRHLAAARAGERFIGDPGDHFVDIHIGLGAAARLPDDQRKLVVMVASSHGGGGGFDRGGGARIQPMMAVNPCRCLLHDGQRMDDADRHPLGRIEGKIFDAALRLRAPIGVGWHFYGADTVGFGAGCGHRRHLSVKNYSQF